MRVPICLLMLAAAALSGCAKPDAELPILKLGQAMLVQTAPRDGIAEIRPTGGGNFPRESSAYSGPYLSLGDQVTVLADDDSRGNGSRSVMIRVEKSAKRSRMEGVEAIIERRYLVPLP